MRLLRLDDDHPLTGWHMLAIVFSFFGTIIAVNLVMAVAATSTFPGLVVQNSYVASQHYDELLARSREQDRAGWRHALSLRDGTLRFSLSQRSGLPPGDLTVSAHVGRPSTTREDRFLSFAAEGAGSYAAASALPAGLWEVDVEATRGGDILFRTTQEVFVPEAEPLP